MPFFHFWPTAEVAFVLFIAGVSCAGGDHAKVGADVAAVLRHSFGVDLRLIPRNAVRDPDLIRPKCPRASNVLAIPRP